jgi:hypothetical protein
MLLIYSLRFGKKKSLKTATRPPKHNFDFSFYQNIYWKVIYVYFYKNGFQNKYIDMIFHIFKLNDLKVIHLLYSQCLTKILSKTISFTKLEGVVSLNYIRYKDFTNNITMALSNAEMTQIKVVHLEKLYDCLFKVFKLELILASKCYLNSSLPSVFSPTLGKDLVCWVQKIHSVNKFVECKKNALHKQASLTRVLPLPCVRGLFAECVLFHSTKSILREFCLCRVLEDFLPRVCSFSLGKVIFCFTR